MPRLPLEGIRVIDLTVVWAGPFGSALLGDLGAEVIKVDSIQRWDVITRGQNPTVEQMKANGGNVRDDAKPYNISANFNSMGRNKKSVTIDLTRKEGQEAFYRLAAKSDVFIENNAPDVVKRFNITYEDLKKHNPQLIMASLPAFGAEGPYSHFRAYGANMEAVVGHTLLRGYVDTDATTVTSVFLADACGGATSAFAIMSALHHRRKTGVGQFIDMSQAENVMHTLSQAIMDYSMNGSVQTTLGNRHPYRAPQGCYPCTGEDQWITVSIGTDEEFAACVASWAGTTLSRMSASPTASAATSTRTSWTKRSLPGAPRRTTSKPSTPCRPPVCPLAPSCVPARSTTTRTSRPATTSRSSHILLPAPIRISSRRFSTCPRHRYRFASMRRPLVRTTSTSTRKSVATATTSTSGSSTTVTLAPM